MRTKKLIEKQEKQLSEITARIMPIAESGRYNGMTIREICEEAGISTGMFYRHFRSKNDVLSIAYILRLKEFLSAAGVSENSGFPSLFLSRTGRTAHLHQ